MDGRREARPRLRACLQRGQAGRREGVDLAVAGAGLAAPLADDEAVALQALQRGVEGALLAAEHVVAPPLDLSGDGVAVQRAVAQHRQHQRRRVPLQQLSLRVHGSLHLHKASAIEG